MKRREALAQDMFRLLEQRFNAGQPPIRRDDLINVLGIPNIIEFGATKKLLQDTLAADPQQRYNLVAEAEYGPGGWGYTLQHDHDDATSRFYTQQRKIKALSTRITTFHVEVPMVRNTDPTALAGQTKRARLRADYAAIEADYAALLNEGADRDELPVLPPRPAFLAP